MSSSLAKAAISSCSAGDNLACTHKTCKKTNKNGHHLRKQCTTCNIQKKKPAEGRTWKSAGEHGGSASQAKTSSSRYAFAEATFAAACQTAIENVHLREAVHKENKQLETGTHIVRVAANGGQLRVEIATKGAAGF
jgi:hypothetical protein